MLEQIASLVKQFGQDSVVNNPDVPNDENNAVLAEATKTISGGMQNMMAGGGLQDIISMFTGGGNNNNQSGSQTGSIASIAKNPMVTMMIGHFVNKLISKFNMSPQKANNVASSLIPNVVSDLVSRTKDSNPDNSSYNLNDLIGSLSGGGQTATAGNSGGGGGFDFQSLINQFTGGDDKKDANSGNGSSGGFDLQDIISKVTQGAQEKQGEQAGGGGGLMDMIKGFISK